jgi:hypothetical protein
MKETTTADVLADIRNEPLPNGSSENEGYADKFGVSMKHFIHF